MSILPSSRVSRCLSNEGAVLGTNFKTGLDFTKVVVKHDTLLVGRIVEVHFVEVLPGEKS